ncbi:unnamed protein product, partial [Adineta steineri]
SILDDEQKAVFALTATSEKLPEISKKQNVTPSRPKIPKKNASIHCQTEWTWKDMEMLERYRVKEPEPEESDSDVDSKKKVTE